MYCHNCGAEVPEWARFCGKCGSKVAENLQPPVEKAPPLPGPEEVPNHYGAPAPNMQEWQPPIQQVPPPQYQYTPPPAYQYTPQPIVTIEGLKEIYAEQDRWEEKVRAGEFTPQWQPPGSSFNQPTNNGQIYGQQPTGYPGFSPYGTPPAPYPQFQGQQPYLGQPVGPPQPNATGEKQYLLILGWISFAVGFFFSAIVCAAGIGFGWAYMKYDEPKGKTLMWANAILLIVSLIFAIIKTAT